MTELIQLEIPESVAIPPEGFVNVFYTEEDGLIVKKGKFHDGSVRTLAEEYEPIEPDEPTSCFTITAKKANTVVVLNEEGDVTGTDLYYSLNDGEWKAYAFGTSVTLENTGNSVRFWNKTNSFSHDVFNYFMFSIDSDVSFTGNIMSLLNFSNRCTEYCFLRLFANCTSLTTAPALPATTLARECCYGMFYGCTNLTTAPALPATALARGCYDAMFANCTSLTTAPELPATTLARGCYYMMFYGCTSLTTVRTHHYAWLDDITSYTYADFWLYGVSSTGTFYKRSALPAEYGSSRIPKGWSVVNID